jgi:hypothetical protein
MKNIFTNLTTLCLLALLSIGCEQKFEPKPLTATQVLTGTEKKTWVLTSAKIIDEKNESPDIKGSDLLDPCELDDEFVFYANEEKKLEYKNGSSKCANAEPDVIYTDSWELLQGVAELDMAIPRLFGGSIIPFTVKTLTTNTMVLEYYFGDIDASYRFTFVSSGK